MTDHPIIFSGPMVRALLDGRKTMTRRLAWRQVPDKLAGEMIDVPTSWQRVKVGDWLWVRESHWRLGRWMMSHDSIRTRPKWRFVPDNETPSSISFEHKFPPAPHRVHDLLGWWLRPSIFLPMAISRLTLIVTATKTERLQEISREDEIAEGTPDGMFFDCLWSSIHGSQSWRDNPEVVALSFSVHQSNIDAMPKDKAA